jgi:hypothetical protein
MNSQDTYKYVAAVLAIIAIIFMVLYFQKDPGSVPQSLEDIATNIENCRDNIAEWRAEYGNNASTTPDGAEKLEDILSECGDSLKDGTEYLSQ